MLVNDLGDLEPQLAVEVLIDGMEDFVAGGRVFCVGADSVDGGYYEFSLNPGGVRFEDGLGLLFLLADFLEGGFGCLVGCRGIADLLPRAGVVIDFGRVLVPLLGVGVGVGVVDFLLLVLLLLVLLLVGVGVELLVVASAFLRWFWSFAMFVIWKLSVVTSLVKVRISTLWLSFMKEFIAIFC